MKSIKSKLIYLTSLTILFVLGCKTLDPHNPFNVKEVIKIEQISSNKYPSHSNKVFLTQSKSIPSEEYEILETIDIGKAGYEEKKEVLILMATHAREIGADIIIELKVWYQPSGFTWVSPHGSGKIIKLKNREKFNFNSIEGEWY